MVYSNWTKKHLLGVALVAVCGLLAGCSPVMGGAGFGDMGSGDPSDGQHGSDATAPGSDGADATSDRPTSAGASGDGEASCLVGTWKEDLSVLTKEMNQNLGDGIKLKWSGDAFLRFDDEGMFFNWTDDSVFEMWLGDDHSRSVTNGAVIGDYVVKNSVIHWSGVSTLFNDSVMYNNGVVAAGESADIADGYRYPAPFSCSPDKLVAHLGSAELLIPRVFYRTTAQAPSY